MTSNVGIVGAGFVGRLLALSLSDAGVSVTLFEKQKETCTESATFAAAGMLAPFCELETAESVISRLGEISMGLWSDILGGFEQPVFLDRKGSLVVAHSQDEGELERMRRKVAALGRKDVMEEVAAEGIAKLEPELAGRFSKGLYFPQEGQISNRAFLRSSLVELKKRPICLLFETEVRKTEPGKIHTNKDCFSFDWVVDARGLGAQDDLPGLRGIRGEILTLHAPDVMLHRPVRIMHPRYPLYVVPRPDHWFIVGATSIETDADEPVTVRSALELLTAAYALHSGFAQGTIRETVVGVRPAFENHLPRIQHQEGLIRINGLYRHGCLVAPAITQMAAAFLMHGQISSAFEELYEEKRP